jgi:hypothetical protein
MASLLHSAAAKGDGDVARALLEAGASVDAVDKQGDTPLHYAAFQGHAVVARALLEAGASVDAFEVQSNTPLLRAAFQGHAVVARALIEAGASVDAVDEEGDTPLHYAADKGHADVARALIEAGASVRAANQQRKTPLHLAADRGHTEVSTALLNAARLRRVALSGDGSGPSDASSAGVRAGSAVEIASAVATSDAAGENTASLGAASRRVCACAVCGMQEGLSLCECRKVRTLACPRPGRPAWSPAPTLITAGVERRRSATAGLRAKRRTGTSTRRRASGRGAGDRASRRASRGWTPGLGAVLQGTTLRTCLEVPRRCSRAS